MFVSVLVFVSVLLFVSVLVFVLLFVSVFGNALLLALRRPLVDGSEAGSL